MQTQILSILAALAVLLFSACQSGNAIGTAESKPQESLFTPAPGSPISFPEGPSNALIGDMNNDKKLDLIVASGDKRTISVLLGNGEGGFVEAKASPFDVGHQAFHAVVTDVNRDGRMDVVAAGGDGLRVMLGDGQGGFAVEPVIPTGRGTWRLDLNDSNGDGKMDVVTSNLESKNVSVLLGR